MICLLERIPDYTELKPDLVSIKTKAESCSRQIKAWAQSLQDSDLKGERYVTEKTRRADQAAREREEFLKELAEIRSRGAAAGK